MAAPWSPNPRPRRPVQPPMTPLGSSSTSSTRRGSGILTPATSIQRINTHGGALSGACAERGVLRAVPYSADYVFLRKGG